LNWRKHQATAAAHPESMKLYLALHGETDLDIDDRYQGSSNEPLNPAGMTQARRLAQVLPADIQRIISSPQQRALQTALTVAQARGLRVEVEPDFRERDFGAFEGLTSSEAAQRHPALWQAGIITAWDMPLPGGETNRQMVQRVSAVLQGLQARYANEVMLVCAHGFVIGALCHLLDGLSTPQLFDAPRLGNAEFIVRHWPRSSN
jgi:broad specificity phosphatase PhoE